MRVPLLAPRSARRSSRRAPSSCISVCVRGDARSTPEFAEVDADAVKVADAAVFCGLQGKRGMPVHTMNLVS